MNDNGIACNHGSMGLVRMVPIRQQNSQVDLEATAIRDHSLRSYTPGARVCRDCSVPSHAKPRRIGPPFVRTACWCVCLSGLLGLGLWLGLAGKVDDAQGAAEIARCELVGRDSFTWQGGVPFPIAARSVAPSHSPNPGVGASSDSQTQQNRELGQLCQTQKWLKRYRIGMFANLAMLANTFSQIRPDAVAKLAEVWGRNSKDRTMRCGGTCESGLFLNA